jgi:osmotically-inducible protein OsmY
MLQANQAEIIKAIYAALEKDPVVNIPRSQIQITIDDHIVLHGKVPNIAAKRVASKLARQNVAGQFEVEDRLRVDTEPLGDAALRDKVGYTLAFEPVISDYSIIVESKGHQIVLRDSRISSNYVYAQVQEGVVCLRGSVDSISHRWLVEALLWWIPGCQRVDNFIDVISDDKDLDNSLTDTVRMMLEKDPLIRSDQIHVGTAAGIVELEGQLTSDEQHEIALLDTWAIPGVEDIYDHITVR